MEQKHLFTSSDKSIQKLKYANYTSGLVRHFVDESSCENMPYTKKSSKKDAKKVNLAVTKEQSEKKMQDCSINSLACNVIGFKDSRI